MEHMVNTMIFARAFHRDDISGLCHHTDGPMITAVVPTDGADILIGQILANWAAVQCGAGFENGVGKGLCIFRWEIQNVKGQPLCCFSADAGQAGKLFS